jgi:hypothetical protein
VSLGLTGTISVSRPANGTHFVGGEAPVLTIKLADRCGRAARAASLGTANLYLSGPRKRLATKTSNKLLNCVVDRAAADRQHHYVNLAAPKHLDPSQKNLSEAADGTLTYKLASIGAEPSGTYTAGVWAKTKDELDQIFPLAELQIGTATREEYASGPVESSSCFECHKGPISGKTNLTHSAPGRSPLGNHALDSAPIATCQMCHNTDGYSKNPAIRKIHGVHRGAKQLAPGAAHPEYGLEADATLSKFTDVAFPSFPGKDLDCAKCHRDGAWKDAPSRLACGTCHDNLFFDTGTLKPPRLLGQPKAGPCAADADCAALGQFAICNAATGLCERKTHPTAKDDSQCAVCHSADDAGVSPNATRHEIPARTRVRGLNLSDVALSGATGASGVVAVGDVLTLKLKLADRTGKVVADLKSNSALSGTVVLAGPTNDPQRVLGPLSMKTAGTLTYDAATTEYTYVFPSAFPAMAAAPLNTDPASFNRVNPPGAYSLWVYVNESLTYGSRSFRDFAGAQLSFKALADSPARPRQVISGAACNSCHVDLQAHGGSRHGGENCFTCHSGGAMDRGVGAKGRACAANTDCRGAAAGWESCQDTNTDSKPDTCVITKDPTPNQTVHFGPMIHAIHFARLREGHAARASLVPGTLSVVGFQNSLLDLSDVLFPQDVRNCTKCHADSGSACKATSDCGVGQACATGSCVNVAWKKPSAELCLSCHDSPAAAAHAAVNTATVTPGSSLESCQVCHGEKAEFSVAKVHALASPYVPPYAREKER